MLHIVSWFFSCSNPFTIFCGSLRFQRSDVKTASERTEVLLTDYSLYLSSVIYCLSLW